jgi:hypothetical protein
MMMAHDSTPSRPELSTASVEGLRLALTRYLGSNEASSLKTALREIAVEAREKKMHAEQLLIILKDVWFALPPLARSVEGDEQNRLLQRIVTLCIREYYCN